MHEHTSQSNVTGMGTILASRGRDMEAAIIRQSGGNISQPMKAAASMAERSGQWVDRWRLTLLFVATAVLAISIAILIINRISGDLAESSLVRTAEENTARDALHIQAMMRHAQAMRNMPSASGNGITGTRRPMPLTLDYLAGPEGLSRNFQELTEGLSVVKIDLFDLNGMTVWSSDPKTIGVTRLESPLLREAVSGEYVSKQEINHEVVNLDGVDQRIDVVKTFLPLRETHEGKIIGVMGIHRDITHDVQPQIITAKSTILRATAGTMGGLFLILFGFIVAADVSIHRSKQRQMSAMENRLAERVQAEEVLAERTVALEAVNRELEAFTYSVSHDLRAPLRSINGFSQALLEDHADALDEHGKDYFHRLLASSQRMGDIIDDLLRLSRLTRGELSYEAVDMSEMARTIGIELQETQPHRQVEFIVAAGVVANGDAQLLRNVLENLLGNAWKFTGTRHRAVVEFGVELHNGERAYFVRDDGIGFDMAYADKLFGAFQRLHSLSEFDGTGIGLATVQRIIDRHGGRVWAEGVVEKGAAFYFTL